MTFCHCSCSSSCSTPLTRFHPQKCPLFGFFFVSFVGFVVCIFSCLVTFAFQTIGASFLQKHVTVDDNRITLQIWDTAGQERFRAMAPLYYRKAKAAVVVFDVTDDRTFRKAKGWLDELKKHVASNVVLCVCANKVDMLEEYGGKMPMGAVPDDELQEYILEENAELFYTSAKNNIGVEGLFESVARKLLKLFLKERANELLRAKDANKKGGGGSGSGNQHNNGRDSDQTLSKRLKISDPKANSRKSEGCC